MISQIRGPVARNIIHNPSKATHFEKINAPWQKISKCVKVVQNTSESCFPKYIFKYTKLWQFFYYNIGNVQLFFDRKIWLSVFIHSQLKKLRKLDFGQFKLVHFILLQFTLYHWTGITSVYFIVETWCLDIGIPSAKTLNTLNIKVISEVKDQTWWRHLRFI